MSTIKAQLATMNDSELGRLYGVSNVLIGKIRKGKVWIDVPSASATQDDE